jgi:hypothetical protein
MLSRIGWFCAGAAVLALGLVFGHFGGFVDAGMGVGKLLAALFWGGISWFALFTLLMAILFLSA